MITVADSNTYYHFDGLGSVIALSDSSEDIVEQYSYDAFGEPNRVSSVGNPYLFTGRRYDEDTSLYYYRARYYHPEIGRFLQTDPLGYWNIESWDSMNLYHYAKNNPVNFLDPTGEISAGVIVVGGIVIWVSWEAFKFWRCSVWIDRLREREDELREKYTEKSTGCLRTSAYMRELINTKELKKVLKWCHRHSFQVPQGVKY